VENVWKKGAKPVEIRTRRIFLALNPAGSLLGADVDGRFAPGFA
jgi:hypothetical protein